MAVPKHVDEAAARLKAASARMEAARRKPVTLDGLAHWLEALTDFSRALADIQSFNNESIHEKLHELAGRAGIGRFPTAGS